MATKVSGRGLFWRAPRFLVPAMALLLPLSASADVGGSIGLTSNVVYRGLTQSDNIAATQADIHYLARSDWFVGLGLDDIFPHPRTWSSGLLEPYIGMQGLLREHLSARVLAIRHQYVGGDRGAHYSYDEAIGTLGAFNRVFLSVAFSPDSSFQTRGYGAYGDNETGRRRTVSYDLAVHQPVFDTLSLNGGAGYCDLHSLVGKSYLYWNAGLGYEIRHVQLTLSYIGTSETARTVFAPDIAVNRLVASAMFQF